MNQLIETLRYHTGKLFGINIIGLLTWLEKGTSMIGFFGAIAAAFVSVMLICIHWEAFMASKPVRWVLNRFKSHQQGMD